MKMVLNLSLVAIVAAGCTRSVYYYPREYCHDEPLVTSPSTANTQPTATQTIPLPVEPPTVQIRVERRPLYFEPAEPPPPATASQPSESGARRRTFASANGQYVQTFTADSEGFLTALQFSLRSQGNAGDLVVEMTRPAKPEEPQPSDPVAARMMIPRFAVPKSTTTSGETPNLVTLDLVPFRIGVKRGEVVATRISFSGGEVVTLEGVLNSSYTGGRLFSYVEDRKRWVPEAGANLVFRVFGAGSLPEEAAASQRATTGFSPNPPQGAVMVEVAPQPQPATVPASQPAERPLIFAAVAFESRGRYFVQITAFNASNGTRNVRLVPASIAITPTAGGEGIAISPARLPAPYKVASTTPRTVGPNEGVVNTIPLGEAATALAPGDYRVTILFPPEVSDKTLTADLSIAPKNSSRD